MQGKDFFLSKTNIGVLMMAIALISQQFGWDIGDSSGWTDLIVGLIGAVLGIYGRVKAVAPITSVGGLKIGQ